MFGIFHKDRGQGSSGHSGEHSRHSRGWAEILAFLKARESLRVLDFGTTSPSNINFLTSMGHSVYMANVVQDANKPEWQLPAEEGSSTPKYDVEGFVKANLDFSGRDFDVVLLWDTASYLPPPMVPALFARLREVLRPEGRLLALFHGRIDGPETAFSRYQLSEADHVQVIPAGDYSVRQVYQMRQIEKLLDGFSSTRFFLGKDNAREVIATR